MLGGIYSYTYNNRNQLVLTCRASGPTTVLDITALAPGCYVVKVVQGEEVKVVKVVVE